MKYSNAMSGDYPPDLYKVNPYKFGQKDIFGFINLVRKNSSESDIDSFLKQKLSLLAFSAEFFDTGHHSAWIIPQAQIKPPGFPSGKGQIPDYLIAGDNSDGVTWWVVELKSPNDKLYKKDKQGFITETSKLSKGLSQLQNYIDFCIKHQSYIRDTLGVTSFKAPYGIIFIGREQELIKDKEKRNKKAYFNRDSFSIQIRTYDAFLRRFRSVMESSNKLPFLGKMFFDLFVKEETNWRDRFNVITS